MGYGRTQTNVSLSSLSEAGQFHEQFLLTVTQPLGNPDLDCNQKVTTLPRIARVGHSLAPQAEGLTAAGASGDP